MRHKASGADVWFPGILCDLPVAWFELLASVWNAILAGASVPIAWAACPVVLAPKNDGLDGSQANRGLWRSVETWNAENYFTQKKIDGMLATPVDRFRSVEGPVRALGGWVRRSTCTRSNRCRK